MQSIPKREYLIKYFAQWFETVCLFVYNVISLTTIAFGLQ